MMLTSLRQISQRLFLTKHSVSGDCTFERIMCDLIIQQRTTTPQALTPSHLRHDFLMSLGFSAHAGLEQQLAGIDPVRALLALWLKLI